MNYKLILALFLTYPSLLSAQPLVPKYFPSDLLYLGRPIDPLCFDQNGSGNYHLNECGAIKQRLIIKNKDNHLSKKNFFGFEWRNSEFPTPGYSYYQAFPAKQKHFWLYTINNGGGTGSFTNINLFNRINDDTFEIKLIDGGDRCNGGIDNVTDKNGTLTYSKNLTGYDLLAMVHQNSKVKAYDNLAACAICCIATVSYELNENLQPKFQYVELGHHTKSEEMPEQGNMQNCFNNLILSYVKSGKNKLDEKQLSALAEEFEDRCVK
jgi:hypothetical protein